MFCSLLYMYFVKYRRSNLWFELLLWFYLIWTVFYPFVPYSLADFYKNAGFLRLFGVFFVLLASFFEISRWCFFCKRRLTFFFLDYYIYEQQTKKE